MGHVGLKTGSLDQILEKPRVHSRSHIFSLILMKLGQNVCLSEILDELETRLLGQILEKPVHSRGHSLCSILLKFGQDVCYDDFLDNFENGSYQIRN